MWLVTEHLININQKNKKCIVVNTSSLDARKKEREREKGWTMEDPDEPILSVCGFNSSNFFFFQSFRFLRFNIRL
jgi:hypothetical protein